MKHLALIILLTILSVNVAHAENLNCRIQHVRSTSSGQVFIDSDLDGKLIIKNVNKDQSEYTIVAKPYGMKKKKLKLMAKTLHDGELLAYSADIERGTVQANISLIVLKNKSFILKTLVFDDISGMDVSEIINGKCL